MKYIDKIYHTIINYNNDKSIQKVNLIHFIFPEALVFIGLKAI